jgi:hypothetical protein
MIRVKTFVLAHTYVRLGHQRRSRLGVTLPMVAAA